MDSRTGRSVTDARDAWVEIAGADGLAPLAELAFGLNLPRLFAAIFGSGGTRPGFTVPPMSEEWLQHHAADSEKHVEHF